MTAPSHRADLPICTAAPAAATRAELGASPLWDDEVGLRWLDVPRRRLLTLKRDGTESSTDLTLTTTCVDLGPGRDLVAVTSIVVGWIDPERGDSAETLRVLDTAPVSMNDGGIDPRGRLWAGSASRDDTRRGNLYRIEAGIVSVYVGDIGMSNGIDWSPEGDVLYHVESTAGTITAWEYDLTTGQLGTSTVLRSVPAGVGLPDGLTVDADGGVWVAIWGAGQVWRLDPGNGDATLIVDVPTPYTSCAFGGPHLSTLYITTANYQQASGGGLLYAAKVPARGRHPQRFAEQLR